MPIHLPVRRPISLAAALAALLAIALCAGAQASAATLAVSDGQPVADPWQRWADQAEGRVWMPDRTIAFTAGPCPDADDALGCADLDGIWVRVGPRRYRQLARHTLYHELGHITDFAMGEPRRREIMELTGWPRWYPERFAETFARCSNPAAFLVAVMRRARPLCALLHTPPPPATTPAPIWIG